MKQTQTLSALVSFPGFRARSRLQGIFGDPRARLGTLGRRQNQRSARAAGPGTAPSPTARPAGCGRRMRRAGVSIWPLHNGEWRARAGTE